jgi:ADP-ribose pyrophosphatase
MSIWKQTSKEQVFKSFLFKVFKVGFRSERSGKEGFFDVLESKSWVNVVPITRQNQVLMVKQFRYGTGQETLEFPAGAIESGQTPMDAVKRELLEETGGLGLVAETGSTHPNPAFLNNICYHFVATDVEVTKGQSLDEYEEIEILSFPLDEIDQMIADGKITHALSIASWYFATRSRSSRAI